MANLIESLSGALDEAQDELAQAEMGLVEASARAEAARLEVRKLKAAVAALSGEPPPAAAPERQETAEMTQEEFDAHRKARQREKRQQEQANNPYGHMKCSGCGEIGKMNAQIITTSTGAPVKLLVCGGCGNQLPA